MVISTNVLYLSFGLFIFSVVQANSGPLSRLDSSSSLSLIDWIFNIHQYEEHYFSQNNEDGVIQYILRNINEKYKGPQFFVEFGVEDGQECSTRYLFEKFGWKGLLMDGSNANSSKNLHKEMITQRNIVNLMSKYNVPKEFGLLSVDTDFCDYHILSRILENNYRPAIIIVEVNSKISPYHFKSVPCEDDGKPHFWEGDDYFSASPAAFHYLGAKFDYSMVYCESKGINCFLLRDDLINSKVKISKMLKTKKLQKPPKYGQYPNNLMMCGGHPPSTSNKSYIDVRPPENTGDNVFLSCLHSLKW
jgi:hypothetical protein